MNDVYRARRNHLKIYTVSQGSLEVHGGKCPEGSQGTKHELQDTNMETLSKGMG
jgi:hypothetical protein